MARIGKTLLRFIREESGNATIEFVVWLPFLTVLIMLITDVTMIAFHRSNVELVIQDANRLRSVGVLTTNEETRQYLISRLTSADGTVCCTIDAGMISLYSTSIVRFQISQVDVFGILSRIAGDVEIVVVNQQIMENMEA